MRDSLVVYRSWFESIKSLPNDVQPEIWNAIFEYGLNFKDTELEGLSKTIWTLIKPNIKANIDKYKAGKSTKSKQNSNKTEAESKQNRSKTKAELKQSQNNVNVNEDVNSNENVNDDLFEKFWNIYDKKTGKKKCTLKWQKLKEETKLLIIERLPAYILKTPDVQFRKDPITYLNNESWDDEIILPKAEINQDTELERLKALRIERDNKELEEMTQQRLNSYKQ